MNKTEVSTKPLHCSDFVLKEIFKKNKYVSKSLSLTYT